MRTAAEMLVALSTGGDGAATNPAINGMAARNSRGRGRGRGVPPSDDYPPVLSAADAAAAHAGMALQRDTVYTAFRKHVPKHAAALPAPNTPTLTNHVLRIVCVTSIPETCLRKDARDAVTHLVVVASKGGPTVELPTFGIVRGMREGVMLCTLLTCFIPSGAPTCPGLSVLAHSRFALDWASLHSARLPGMAS